MSYRAPDDGFLTCRRCGADLADGAAFCPECGTPQHAAHVSHDRRAGGRNRWWVPAGIVAGGIVALVGGAIVGLAVFGGPGATAGGPSPSPSGAPTGSTDPSTSSSAVPSASGTAASTASPTPVAAPVIANRAVVEVATDVLNVRSAPNETASVLGSLERGRRLFVIGDPRSVGDLRWYRVGSIAGEMCEDACDLLGYVATPLDAEDEAWITEVTIGCPASPMTAADLAALEPLEALHCYGRNDIVVTGVVETPCCGYVGPFAFSPAWLAHPQVPAFLQDGLPHGGFRVAPGAGLEVPERGDVVRVTGHFEDPAATTCRVSVDESFWGDASPEPVQLPDAASVVLGCRAVFVWTDYEVTDHLDLGPCCGSLLPDRELAGLPRA